MPPLKLPVLFASLCLPASLVLAQSQVAVGSFPKLTATSRLNQEPAIDGKIDAVEWKEAAVIDGLVDRVTGQAPADKTVVYAGHSEKGLYFAFTCYDSEPDKIIGREITPNAEFRGEDQIVIDLNFFGTRAFDQLNEFFVNAIGTQTERIAGGKAGKREWRGEWKAATSRFDQGWQCEVMIPWSMLTYPDQKELKIDANFIRKQGRTLFEQSWANARPNPLPELQGQWTGVFPPKPKLGKKQFLVYDAIDVQAGGVQNRIGIDARVPLTPTLNGLASFSPDFRNVEDVIAGNDFVRTERFLDDPRPFFQEGNRFFDASERFGFGRMFYTRRITNFDFGTKVFGNIDNKQSIGALHTAGFDGTSATVLKYQKVNSGQSSQRAYLTRNTTAGVENIAYGGLIQRRGPTLGFSAEGAREQTGGGKADSAFTANLGYTRPTTQAGLRYVSVDPNFSPGLGFIPWVDRRGFYGFLMFGRDWRKGPFRDYRGSIFYNQFNKITDGEKQQIGWNGSFQLATRTDVQFSLGKDTERYEDGFDDVLKAGVTFNASNRFRRFGVGYESGKRRSLDSEYLAIDASWRLRDNFDVGFRRSVLELQGTSTQTIFTAQLQTAADQLIAMRVAQTGTGTNAYLSFRKAGLAGTEYYLILGDPNAPKTANRISMKLVWAY